VNNVKLLVGLVDKMCFKTLFVTCMNLKSYQCIVVCSDYVCLCGL
jgi:hypothetical protein